MLSLLKKLVFKVSNTGHHHRHSVVVTIFDAIAIAYRATGLNHCVDAFFVGNLHTVGEGEKCIARHHSSMQIVMETVGFFYGMLQCIHA